MFLTYEDLIKIGLAILVGGLIGGEREYRDKAAGFRTIILITLGSTLFTIYSIKLAGANNDPMRVAANILTGIGFIGAGAILRGERGVVGLTTAATIWLSAALGLGIGGGEYLISLLTTVVVLAVLWVFPYFERGIDRVHHLHVYQVTIPCSEEHYGRLAAAFRRSGLRVLNAKRTKNADTMICTWMTTGSPKTHEALVEAMLYDPAILALDY